MPVLVGRDKAFEERRNQADNAYRNVYLCDDSGKGSEEDRFVRVDLFFGVVRAENRTRNESSW